MDDNFSSRVKDVITYSKEEALRLVMILLELSTFSWYVERWWRKSY